MRSTCEWETADLFHEWDGGKSTEGRETEHEVILVPRLRAALERLNPDLPPEAITQAIDELTRDRSKMIKEEANREVYRLLKVGVKVDVRGDDGSRGKERACAKGRPDGIFSRVGVVPAPLKRAHLAAEVGAKAGKARAVAGEVHHPERMAAWRAAGLREAVSRGIIP